MAFGFHNHLVPSLTGESMLGNQWVDIDLDYFNGMRNPVGSFERMLNKLPEEVPTHFCINHQDVLPHIRKAVKNHLIETPMTIFRVDDHHDYYFGKPGKGRKLGCGNFGYQVPLHAYNKFVWVTQSTNFEDMEKGDGQWANAKRWLHGKGKKAHISRYWNWNRCQVGLVTITVSPDYQQLAASLNAMLELAGDYFHIKRRPYVKRDGCLWRPNDWHMRPRVVVAA